MQVHPTVMFSLLGVTIYTGILGWNYRQARLIPVRSLPVAITLYVWTQLLHLNRIDNRCCRLAEPGDGAPWLRAAMQGSELSWACRQR